MVNTALSAKKKNHLPKQDINSGCQLAGFRVTGSTNPLGFGSVAPKKNRKVQRFGE